MSSLENPSGRGRRHNGDYSCAGLVSTDQLRRLNRNFLLRKSWKMKHCEQAPTHTAPSYHRHHSTLLCVRLPPHAELNNPLPHTYHRLVYNSFCARPQVSCPSAPTPLASRGETHRDAGDPLVSLTRSASDMATGVRHVKTLSQAADLEIRMSCKPLTKKKENHTHLFPSRSQVSFAAPAAKPYWDMTATRVKSRALHKRGI